MSLAAAALCALLIVGPAPTSYPAPPDTLLRFGVPRGWTSDALRLRILDGEAAAPALLVRSHSDTPTGATTDRSSFVGPLSIRLLAPEASAAVNSNLPLSLNEGSLWAGRGVSGHVRAGAHLSFRALTLVLAPELWRSENRPFQTFSYPENDTQQRLRHPLASPFHYPPHSADLPQRLGTEVVFAAELGESSVSVHAGPLRVGLGTERLFWGPGLRNQLVMSGHGPGFPHAFVQTTAPVATPLGTVHARWILGQLEESPFFDFDPENDFRSLSGIVAVLNPPFEPNLSLGIARAVYAPADGVGDLAAATFDFLRPVGAVASVAGDTLLAPGRDQLTSFFIHWTFPADGFEVWGEWGRSEEPRSLRDFLALPQSSRGYTLGGRYVSHPSQRGRVSFEAELTSLEPSQAFRVRQHGEWYTSRRVPQGYTHRGRVLGAAIGPSGSSQWLALDWLGQRWQLGAFGTRIRWENEALYSYAREFRRADLTLLGGVRAFGRLGPLEVQASYAASVRLNYMFQTTPLSMSEDRGVDIPNRVGRLTLRYLGR